MAVQDLFLDPETLNDPYDYFASLREEAPVFFSKSLNAYAVTRYSDVQYVLQNPEIFSSSAGESKHLIANFTATYFPIYEAAGTPTPMPTLVVTDGSVHQRYRRLVDSTFNAVSVHKLQPSVESLVDHLIEGIVDRSDGGVGSRGNVDLYADFCLKLPIYVVCDILGLPREDAAILKRGADATTRLAGGALETEEARCALHREQVELQLYLQPHIDRYRKKAEDNLISKLIHTTPDDGQPLSDRELLALISLLNVGGNETTTNGLGNMFQICFNDERLQDRLRRDSSEIPKFVEEALRLESPVRAMPRFVSRDAEIGGVTVPRGSFLLLSFAAANRDPAKFDCPAKPDTNRSGPRNHMAFGMGVHYCLGAMMARMELRIALERVLRHMGDIRIETGGRPILHERKMTVRALTSLPISFTRLN